MTLKISPLAEHRVRQLIDWCYEPPYDIYNIAPKNIEQEIAFFTDSENGYYALQDENDELLGFCCFGPDGQVPGGDYNWDALDVGIGMRPDLTGQGQGHRYAEAVFDFAWQTFSPTALRVTIAEFNKRSIRVCEKTGFQQVQRFTRPNDGLAFVMLMLPRKS